jgi:ectoine hydroxylase-related dioxygenase (phytanoyl-CoA dioxygenase family)
MDGVTWSAELAEAVTHPVALWLLQQYLCTDAIHFCHQPVITTLKPADELLGSFPEGGWHTDYPYHPGVFPGDHWPDDSVFGAQYNICIDPFNADYGATQFVPESHRLGRWPTTEFNLGGTRMGEGIHSKVRQMEASAGSALIYDARTWHRACHELNVSGCDRIALLNAVTPAWVRPMIDKTPIAARYRESEVASCLSERVAGDIERLCHSKTLPAPEGVPTLQRRQRKPTQ